MGLTGHRRRAGSSTSRTSSVDGDDSDTTVVEGDQGNVLGHIISQLRPGADLSRVVLPTFILEPRSMLERITNFMCHPEMLLPIPQIQDPVERFAAVVKFYLSGWHIRPPGVKKPLNPILGEIFTCYWDLPDNTRAYYISEQTSHHPPKSSYFYMVPDHHIRVDGTLKPRSKFLGNSAGSMMEGTAVLTLLNRGKDPKKGEKYILTQPNMYARGILFGKMKYELGDHSFVRCPELGLVADIEFKTKGWVSGTYNAIGGTVRNENTGETLFELSGLWSDEMVIKDLRNGHKEAFFNGAKAKPSKPQVRPLEEQDERESQKLWGKTARAVKDKNHELATDEKTKIEDMQREEAAKRAAENVEWHPRLFRAVRGGPGGEEEGEEELEWIINAHITGDTPQKQTEQVMAIHPIIPGQKSLERNVIPPPASVGHPSTAVQPPAQPAPADLIDFGNNEAPAAAPVPAENPNIAAAAEHRPSKDSTEIRQLLSSTGHKAPEGPLIDFSADMKHTLPQTQPTQPSTLKRNETEESNDAFFDAEP
ncbi:putative Oxysterol-binding protein-like protein OBPalpha [Seiridium unicorne]|uniref:Oxysterol-binding protein-like protein OBPalpha n=1 Tax=Seiridium unicorne TaxID=138068 RepID=A0ABR2V3V7_9PEZI